MRVFCLKDLNHNDQIESLLIVDNVQTNKDGEFITANATLILTESWSTGKDGKCNIPDDTSFLASIYYKWNSCTHWYFRGEENDKSGYYHICSTFNQFIRAQLFAVKVMEEILMDNGCEKDHCIHQEFDWSEYKIEEVNTDENWVKRIIDKYYKEEKESK